MGDLGYFPPGLMPVSKLARTTGSLDLSSCSSNSVAELWENLNVENVFRSLVMMVFFIIAWFAQVLLAFFPQVSSLQGPLSKFLQTRFPSSGKGNKQESPSAPVDCELEKVNVLTNGPIGRSLQQVLSLVNDLPASSSKYAFARGLAETVIRENAAYGHGYDSVNRAALCVGFKRTLLLLTRSLEDINDLRSSSGVDLWGLPKKLLKALPISSPGLRLIGLPPLSMLLSQVGLVLPSVATTSAPVSPTAPELRLGNLETAEKLSQELLWLADKLVQASGLDEAAAQWSSLSSLASISLTASPRVQRALVRLSALFVREVAFGNLQLGMDGKFRLLRLWLPLCCAATHGGEGPILSVSEIMDFEDTLSKIIKALPDTEQEVIMGVWLQQFALSLSDWPNLQSTYDGWCKSTRSLNHLDIYNT